MIKETDNYYMEKDEPMRSCLLAVRDLILSFDKNINEAWKYKMPFFCFKDRMFCYVWIDKVNLQPYLGIVEGKRISHPKLVQGNRSRMRIFYLDPNKDLPVRTIREILKLAIKFYT